ncbi:putative aldo-keto reductase 1 [Fagus crenata]
MAEEQKVQIPRVKLGTKGLEVSKLGFGFMGLSGGYNDPVPEEVGVSIIKHAFSKGITFFDTSDIYGPHLNEILLGKLKAAISFSRNGKRKCTSASLYYNIGTSKIKNLDSNIASLRVKLSKEDLKEIADVIPAKGVAGYRTIDAFVNCSWKFANTQAKESN